MRLQIPNIGFQWTKPNAGCDMACNCEADDLFMGLGRWNCARIRKGACWRTRGSPDGSERDVMQADHCAVRPHCKSRKLTTASAIQWPALTWKCLARAPVKDWTCWGNEIPREFFRAAA